MRRTLEHLSMMEVPSIDPTSKSFLVVETVPIIRDSLIKNKNFKEIANYQKKHIFNNDLKQIQAEMKLLSDLYNYDMIDE